MTSRKTKLDWTYVRETFQGLTGVYPSECTTSVPLSRVTKVISRALCEYDSSISSTQLQTVVNLIISIFVLLGKTSQTSITPNDVLPFHCLWFASECLPRRTTVFHPKDKSEDDDFAIRDTLSSMFDFVWDKQAHTTHTYMKYVVESIPSKNDYKRLAQTVWYPCVWFVEPSSEGTPVTAVVISAYHHSQWTHTKVYWEEHHGWVRLGADRSSLEHAISSFHKVLKSVVPSYTTSVSAAQIVVDERKAEEEQQRKAEESAISLLRHLYQAAIHRTRKEHASKLVTSFPTFISSNVDFVLQQNPLQTKKRIPFFQWVLQLSKKYPIITLTSATVFLEYLLLSNVFDLQNLQFMFETCIWYVTHIAEFDPAYKVARDVTYRNINHVLLIGLSLGSYPNLVTPQAQPDILLEWLKLRLQTKVTYWTMNVETQLSLVSKHDNTSQDDLRDLLIELQASSQHEQKQPEYSPTLF